MENQYLQQLAGKLSLTNSEPEPYILTKDEEAKAILNAIVALKNHKSWKYSQMGLKPMEIDGRIASINFIAEINQQEVLTAANSAKHYKIWEQSQRQAEKQSEISKHTELKEKCNYNYFRKLMEDNSINLFSKKLIFNQYNELFIQAICLFLSNDSRAENYNIDLNKGILIRGISGLGKTYVIKCLANNELKPINIISMLEICSEIKMEGEYNLKPSPVTYLDDLGSEEPTVNYFGTKINWFKDFIELYYMKNIPFNRLIISTNNSFDEIEAKYGFRVRSRMKDMFNVIDLKGQDMRG